MQEKHNLATKGPKILSEGLARVKFGSHLWAFYSISIAAAAICWGMTASAGAQGSPGEPEPVVDPEAMLFVNTCLHCHPGTLTGNELINAPSRARENIESTVRRMQDRTGPLTEKQITDLTDLMKDPAFYDRVAEAKLTAEESAAANSKGSVTGSPEDIAAKLYINKCAGCHSLSGAGKSGGSLARAMSYPDAQLWTAVKRMEIRVGALSDDEVTSLVALLKEKEIKGRLTAAGYVEAQPQPPPPVAVFPRAQPPARKTAEEAAVRMPLWPIAAGLLGALAALLCLSYRLHKNEKK